MSNHGVRILFLHLLPVLLIALAPSSAVSQSRIYSWVDSNGVRHFSAMPPANRTDYQIVSLNTVRSTVETRDANPAGPKQPREPEQPQQPEQEEDGLLAPGTTATVIDPAIIERNCERARQNVFLIDSRRRIIVTGANGEQRRLNDDERMNLLDRSKAYIKENCQDG